MPFPTSDAFYCELFLHILSGLVARTPYEVYGEEAYRMAVDIADAAYDAHLEALNAAGAMRCDE